MDLTADLRGFEGYTVKEFYALEGTDMKAVNTEQNEAVKPVRRQDAVMDGNTLEAVLKPASFVTIVLGR